MGTITINPDDLAATRTNLGLGTASTLNTGTANGNVPVVGSDGKLSASILPASGGSVTATASGAIAAGKCVILNSNGTVSEISATSISHAVGSDYTQSGETAAEINQLVYDTTDNHFIWGGKNTISGSTAGRVYALDMNSSLAISEAAPPAAAGGLDAAAWSATYDETLQRSIFHGSNSSNYVRAHTVNVVSGAMKVSPSINWKNSNYPYGFTRGFDADELMVAYQSASTTLRMAFVDITKGSDASGDSFSGFTSEIDPDELDATSTSNAHYSQIVPFPLVSKFLIGHFGNLSGNRSFEFAIGSVGGSSGGSRTFSQDMKGIFTSTGVSTTAVAASVDPVGFSQAGRVEYDATKDRAFVFDSEFLYSISVDSNGVASMSQLERIQANANTANFFTMKSIPNSDHLVCFFASQANSNRSSYRVATFNKGATAAQDTFTVGSEVEINTNAVALSYTPVAYSPDVDAFMIKEYRSGSAQPFYGVRVGRTTTNVKPSGTDARYLGVAKSSVSNGQSVEISVTGSVATMASGGMSVGTTFFVQNDGSVGTTDRNFGTAGVAVSATQLLLE